MLECVGTKESSDTAFAVAKPGPSSDASVCRTTSRSTPRAPSTATSACAAGRHRLAPTSPAFAGGARRVDINPGKVFDLTTDLDHIAEAYAAMDERRAIKALIKVSER